MKLDDAGNDQRLVECPCREHRILDVKHEIQWLLDYDYRLTEFC